MQAFSLAFALDCNHGHLSAAPLPQRFASTINSRISAAADHGYKKRAPSLTLEVPHADIAQEEGKVRKGTPFFVFRPSGLHGCFGSGEGPTGQVRQAS